VQVWALGAGYGFPEESCCACGKGDERLHTRLWDECDARFVNSGGAYDPPGGASCPGYDPRVGPPPPKGPAWPVDGYAYTDLRDLGVHGRAFDDTKEGQYYSRFPASAEADVTSKVWSLSLQSTNQYVRFTTDAKTLHIVYGVQRDCKGLWHMPKSGTCYVDLYAFDETVADWRHLGPVDISSGNVDFYSLMDASTGGTPAAYSGRNTTYLLYLPVRNTLVDDSAAVGVPSGAYIAGTAAQTALRPTAPGFVEPGPASAVAAAGDVAPVLRGGSDAIVWYATGLVLP
jgi:hypothetical protein